LFSLFKPNKTRLYPLGALTPLGCFALIIFAAPPPKIAAWLREQGLRLLVAGA